MFVWEGIMLNGDDDGIDYKTFSKFTTKHKNILSLV